MYTSLYVFVFSLLCDGSGTGNVWRSLENYVVFDLDLPGLYDGKNIQVTKIRTENTLSC